MWADLAVIVAVAVGLVTLGLQWKECWERLGAVDALIRAWANRLTFVWRTMLGNRPAGDPEGVNNFAWHVGQTGELSAGLLISEFTTIAAQVTYASPSMRRQAREVTELFWSIVARTEAYRQRLVEIEADVRAALERDHGRVQTLLTQIAASWSPPHW